MTTLFQAVSKFIDTLETFEYFDAAPVRTWLKDKDEETVGQELSKNLSKYISNVLDIVNSDKVPSNAQVRFLDDITLFGGTLNLGSFKAENRKTKRAIVKHLSNILAMSLQYSNTIPESMPVNPMALMSDPKIMDMFKSNGELSSIVKKMTDKLVSSKVDPASLLTSIMTGQSSGNDDFLKDMFSEIESDIKKIKPEDMNDITSNFEHLIGKQN